MSDREWAEMIMRVLEQRLQQDKEAKKDCKSEWVEGFLSGMIKQMEITLDLFQKQFGVKGDEVKEEVA